MVLGVGADSNVQDDLGLSALHYVAMRGSIKVASTLVSSGADVNAVDVCKNTFLHWAAYYGHGDFITMFWSAYSPLMINKDGRTLLHLAVIGWGDDKTRNSQKPGDIKGDTTQEEREALVRALLDRGLLRNQEDTWKRLPLHYAAIRGSVNLVKVLLSAPSQATLRRLDRDNIMSRDNNGNLPFHYAIKGGHHAVARLLLEHGGKGLVDELANQELHVIAGTEIIFSHQTALHFAVEEGNEEMVQLLLAHGANSTIEDRSGRTPIDIARDLRYTTILDLLKQASDTKHKRSKCAKRRRVQTST
ncbi:hypothetical protein VTK73DRAFT_10420 [Phialemonium thermophilum]|uniref:Uncharacterized protein n=1 Tax=Phialemonium thermophilum TaxID=223376 RepID=A0ABR3VWS1_9PEZI